MTLSRLLNPGPEPTYENTDHPTHVWPLRGEWARREGLRRYAQAHPTDPVVVKAKRLLAALEKQP